MLVKGDKIKLVNPINDRFDNCGEIFEVDSINANNDISFHGAQGIGVMSIDEFEKYFSKVRSWGKWVSAMEDRFGGYDSENVFQYRTDGKRVVVQRGNLTGRASCNKGDTFDLSKGLDLALARLRVKEVMATM